MLAALVGAPLSAQDVRFRERTPPEGFVPLMQHTSRPSLGLVVDVRAGPTDSIGARIESVTPGGPADRAGIRSGDIIVRFDGRSLLDPPNVRGAAPSPQSGPALRLIIHTTQLAPNDTVPMQVRRGKNVRNVRVVTEPSRTATYWRQPLPSGDDRSVTELRQKIEMMRSPEPGVVGEMPSGAVAHAVPDRMFFLMSPLANLQLAPLNEELGRYFGTGEGILVISAPKTSGLRLRGGDVILKVDGRIPSSPIHLLRILQSYDPQEGVKLDILRNRKKETLEGSLAVKR